MDLRDDWLWDEFRQVGTDYGSFDEVADYDRRMQKLRNIPQEVEHILNALDLAPESTVLEIGTGTGEFAVLAAARCARVYAVDISDRMLEYARNKASAQGVRNIEFIRAGFLTYEHDGPPVDAVVSQLALHHLPDYWKAVALTRLYDMLKTGGRFYLRDVVFPGNMRECGSVFDGWIRGVETVAGSDMAREVEVHIREEYSTADWIMEELLRRSGFAILSAEHQNGLMAEYICTKA